MSKQAMLCLASLAVAASLGVTACAPHPGPSPQAASPGASTPAPPTPLPQATRTTSPAPPPTSTATPEPTATPLPRSERLRQAILLQENGEYEAASAALRSLTADGDAETRRVALLRLGRSELQAGAHRGAADALARFLVDYPQDPEAPTALFWLAQAQSSLGEGQQAAETYRRYLQHRPFMEGYVQERIGDALAKAGDHQSAVAAYRRAAELETGASVRARILESLARSERALQRPDEAVRAYDEILKIAQIAAYRAQISYEAGFTLSQAGRSGEAASRWNELVATYPSTSYAAQALAELDRQGLARVDALTRARVEYGAGRYEAALSILRRIILEDPDHVGDAHYYAALAHRQLGRHADSVRELDWLIDTHPQNALVPEGRYQKAESLVLMGAIDRAVATFQQLAASHPQHARGIEALWRVAEVYENAGRAWEAAAAYARAAATYPGASYAANARFRAGFVHYLAGRFQTAGTTWADLLPRESSAPMRARLLLWQGKAAQKQNDPESARARWGEAVAASPASFWGLRARDLMAGRPFVGQAPAGAFDVARYLPRGSQQEAETWLAGWAGPAPAGQALAALPQAVASLPALQRGAEFWALGDSPAAYAQLRQVEAACASDPRALYALSLYCRDRGLYLLATTTTQRVLDLAPPAARTQAPRFIEELAYPTYFADLVLREAQATNTDPLLFFALVRQESMFDPNATSYSDARGLAQVIPSTGKYIAGKLGLTGFDPQQLWRPATSIRFGMWYIAEALRMFNDNALIALVGYNAGPSRAASWAKVAGGDDDVYFEQVNSAQPRAYMQKIYEHRAHYERLYR